MSTSGIFSMLSNSILVWYDTLVGLLENAVMSPYGLSKYH